MNDTYVGTVIWFDAKRGFGFIQWNKEDKKQKDIFVHFSDIKVEGFKTLLQKQMVSFELGKNYNNIIKAVNVCVI